jgi:hypothetical protein
MAPGGFVVCALLARYNDVKSTQHDPGKTVLVLGAGTSVDFKYPTGAELRENEFNETRISVLGTGRGAADGIR